MPQDGGRRGRPRAWIWRSAGVVALALYVATAAPGLLWGDSGEAQLHVLLRGWTVDGEIARSHVLYYAVARLIAWLLPFDAARAANLVAALFGALTVANAGWLCATLCRRRTPALCGTLLVMLSHTLWQLSTSAEVMTLTTALLSAELMAIIKLVESKRLRWLAAAALLNGLGVSNHNLALLMWPVYGVVAIRWRAAWRPKGGRAVALAAGGLALGLLPVLALCVGDLLAGGSPAATLQSLFIGHYGGKVANVSNLVTLLGRTAAMTALNFPTPLFLLAVPGCWVVRRAAPAPIGWVLIGTTIVFTAFAARYNVPDQHTFLLPSFMMFAVLAAVALDGLPAGRRWSVSVIAACALSAMGPVVYAGAPPLLRRLAPHTTRVPTRAVPYRDRFDWFLRPWRCGYEGAERFARETLTSLPEGAWLVVDTTLNPPLNYLQAAESLRQDVHLDSWGARQEWLQPPGDLTAERAKKLDAGLLFAVSEDPRYLPLWLRAGSHRFERSGHVFRVVGKE